MTAMHRYLALVAAMTLAFSISCTTLAPAPHHKAPQPGMQVSQKPYAGDEPVLPPQEQMNGRHFDAAQVLRQIETQNQQFNEQLYDVISSAPKRSADLQDVSTVKTRNGDTMSLSFNFYDADLQEVVRLFMDLLEQNYSLHPQVAGRVSLSVDDTFRRDQLVDLLEGILRINGMALVQNADIWEIMPLSRVPSQMRSGIVHYPDDGLSPVRGQMIQAFRLHFIPTSEMTTIIRPYLSEGAQVYAHDANGIMLILDYPHSLTRVAQLIEIFDESVFARVFTKTYALIHVQAEEAAKELEEIAKTFGLGREADGVHRQVAFLPLSRLNMLLVLARDQHVMEFIDAWVTQVDRELPSFIQEQYGESIFVYYVQYGNASEIVTSLQGLFEFKERPEEEQRSRLPTPQAEVPRTISAELPPLIRDQPFPSGQVTPGAVGGELSGPVVFVVDEPNNAVLVRCSAMDYSKILAVMEKLDQYPKQVLIEVVIAEVQLNEDMQLGMEWRMISNRPGILQDMSLDTNIGGVFPAANPLIDSGLSYLVQNTARFQAALKASAEDGHLRILSTPTLLASDNKPAVINIGDEVPIPTSTLTREDESDPRKRSTETTIQYRDTGIILKVTPKINKQGMVRMEISQEVSSLSTQIVRGVDAPVIATRHTSTTVAVNDQQTIVIGGLMSQTQSDTSSGVPGLSRVPILKHLFGVQRRRFANSELMIFITPHVVIDEQDSRFITRDFLDRLGQIKNSMR